MMMINLVRKSNVYRRVQLTSGGARGLGCVGLSHRGSIVSGNEVVAQGAPTGSGSMSSSGSMVDYNKRHFGTWGMRFIMGFTIVGIMFFTRRWTPRQRKRIIEKFKKGPDEIDILSMTAKERLLSSSSDGKVNSSGPSSVSATVAKKGPEGAISLGLNQSIPFDRQKEENYLNNFLSLPPIGPLVVVGPEGCGKSHIVRKIISSRPMSILVDMRQNAVMSGDELLLSFLKKLGYLLPSSDPISALIMKPEKKQKINVQEIVQGLDTVFQALIEIRDKYQVVPLITISNLEALNSSENFTRFLDWCISITDNKLANILFLTSSQFVHFHLDSNQSFKKRRFIYNINFPALEGVRYYLSSIVTTSGLESVKLLKEEETEDLIEIFGGQMRDIDLISGLVFRGENYKYVVDLFLSETVHKIGSLVDSMYQKSNQAKIDDKEKKSILEKYQRFWQMLEIITERQTIRVSDLIQEVFDEQPEELDEYFRDNTIYFWMGTVNQHNLPEISMAVNSSTPPAASATGAQPDQCVPASETSTVEDSHQEEIKEIVPEKKSPEPVPVLSVPGVSGYDTFVSFSAPRIQYAVKMLLKDHRFLQQRASVEKYFRKADLKDDRKESEEKKLVLHAEYEKVASRLESLIENSEQWIKAVGESDFTKRKQYLIEEESKLESELTQTKKKLFEIEQELDKK